jgi:protoheme IX farnesyltransferase
VNNSEQEQKHGQLNIVCVGEQSELFSTDQIHFKLYGSVQYGGKFLIAPNEQFYVREKLISVLLLFVAGMLVTGSANAINQILEKTSDGLMMRTAKRPVASGRMSVNEAGVFAFITGAAGVFMMWKFFNTESAMVSLFSLFLYGFIYTPLNKVNSICVLVGDIPGALPCLIGWVAAW